jgi:hypothetical protein
MQWLKRLTSFFGLFMSITSLVANLGMPFMLVSAIERKADL